ncbi:hydrogenase formation protein HypD [Fibrobacterota bacterium]
MELIKAFRNPEAADNLSNEIHQLVGQKAVKIMEVCGGQTHTIYKYRLKDLLPPGLKLVSGPGCPVCVTPVSYIDKAVRLALDRDVSIFTFGDLIRVPGSELSLEQAAAEGGDIQTVYSALQAVEAARRQPDRQTVFLGIGFETTVPSLALSILKAEELGLDNFSMLLSAKQVPPVLDALLMSEKVEINGFITPGHVTAVIGTRAYDAVCERHRVPMACGGFEPLDILMAVRDLCRLVLEKRHDNINAYTRVAGRDGNIKAQQVIEQVFEPADEELRGIGVIPGAGYAFNSVYRDYDAERKFDVKVEGREAKGCICGEILAGVKEPVDCPLFRKQCTPGSPVGACMVSSEGCCSAAYLYDG